MLSRQRVIRLAQRIEALAAPTSSRARIGVIWRMLGETDDAARRRHAQQYPGDAVESMLIIGPEPMSITEWEQKYCVMPASAEVRER